MNIDEYMTIPIIYVIGVVLLFLVLVIVAIIFIKFGNTVNTILKNIGPIFETAIKEAKFQAGFIGIGNVVLSLMAFIVCLIFIFIMGKAGINQILFIIILTFVVFMISARAICKFDMFNILMNTIKDINKKTGSKDPL